MKKVLVDGSVCSASHSHKANAKEWRLFMVIEGGAELTMGGSSEEEGCCSEDSLEDDESCMLVLHKDLIPRLTNRKTNKCEARWISEGSFTGMAEVVKFKGKHMKSTGINRHSHVLLHIEEIGYLLQREALTVLNGDSFMTVMDIYSRIMSGTYGCTWGAFKAYLELKNLGYIIGRHKVLWSNSALKSRIFKNSLQELQYELSSCFEGLDVGSDSYDQQTKNCTDMHENLSFDSKMSVHRVSNHRFADRQDTSTGDFQPMFDVYSPSCNFKKTNPGTPDFSLCILSQAVPDRGALEALNAENEGIPVRFATVDAGRVSFFQFDQVQLPPLP